MENKLRLLSWNQWCDCPFEPLKDGQLSANRLVSDVHGRCPLPTDHNVLSAKKRRWQ